MKRLLHILWVCVVVTLHTATPRQEAQFYKAISSGRYETVRKLLNDNPELLGTQEYGGDTPLHLACRRGKCKIVALLIGMGAQTDITDTQGNTPLHLATGSTHQETAKLLLAVGANPNPQDNLGQTPLHLAVQDRQDKLLKLLLQHGAHVNLKNMFGNTALHEAIERNHNEKVIELLLKQGAGIHIKNRCCLSSLDIAMQRGDRKITRMLLKYEAQFAMKKGNTKQSMASVRPDYAPLEQKSISTT